MTGDKDLNTDYDADFLEKIGFISDGEGSDKPAASAREVAETVHKAVGGIGQEQKLSPRIVQQKCFELTYR